MIEKIYEKITGKCYHNMVSIDVGNPNARKSICTKCGKKHSIDAINKVDFINKNDCIKGY